MDLRDESGDEPISTEMLKYIRDSSQYYPNVKSKETHY